MRGEVYVAPMEASLCRQCAHDLLKALEPKAQTIPLAVEGRSGLRPAHTPPQASSRRVVRKSSAARPKDYWDFLRDELETLLRPYADKDGYIYILL